MQPVQHRDIFIRNALPVGKQWKLERLRQLVIVMEAGLL